VLGTPDLLAYLEKYDLTLDSHFDGIMGRSAPPPFHNPLLLNAQWRSRLTRN
jgi:hypothetical protein